MRCPSEGPGDGIEDGAPEENGLGVAPVVPAWFARSVNCVPVEDTPAEAEGIETFRMAIRRFSLGPFGTASATVV